MGDFQNFDIPVVFSRYTPKNKRVFASWVVFGRKYADYEMLSYSIEYQ